MVTAASLAIGEIVGNHRIVETLSVGGMGTVYRAQHTLLGRFDAVKVLNPEMCTNREIVTRFFNEAKATTAIKHPGIVEIFDYGVMPSGHAYIVMELLEGMTLAQRMKLRSKVSEGEAAMVMRGVCNALAAAHAKGIVHRDLKPDNIFILPDPDAPLGERCKLLDFGIAKLTDVGMASSATKTGTMLGTPTYMSPEQCRGTGDVDHRADLYSIGCILYQLLAGRPPFVLRGAGELIGAHLYAEPAPASKYAPELGAETDALVAKLLQKDPDHRVQSARELAAELSQIAQRQGWAVTEAERISLASVPVVAPSFTPVFVDGTPAPPAPLLTEPVISIQQPTTLSTAAGQPEAPTTFAGAPRRRRRLWIASGGAAVAIALLSVGLVASQRNGHEQVIPAAPAAVVTPPTLPPEPPPPPPPPPPAPVVVTPPAPSPVPPPKPKHVAQKPAVRNPAPPKPAVTEPPKPATTLIEKDL